MADWSSLPPDLVTRIADCLLATNDVDCYMDFRAVCTNWRSSTKDPKNSSELRFRPRRWIIVDEFFQTDARLMVNTLSGRVVRKDLPLRRYCIVATTHGGFFVLADREPPHAAFILNPLTGHLIRFTAPVPSEVDVSAAVVGTSPTTILLSDRNWMHYIADPNSEWFTVHEHTEEYCHQHNTYPMNRLAFLGGMHASGERVSLPLISVGLARKISDLMTMLAIEPSEVPPTVLLLDRCFIVGFHDEVFIIFNIQHHMVVYKLDTDNEVIEPMKSIGSLAIFVGFRRCFIVDSEKFPSIDAECIYYVKSADSCADIYKYNLKEEKGGRISEAILFKDTCKYHPGHMLFLEFSITDHSFEFPHSTFHIDSASLQLHN
ncbi:hypothetical protein ACQ4PT_072261 [Festuca glaucescens]